MKRLEIPQVRLLNQRIAGDGLDSPAGVVRWMGAIQAQDYAAAKWAVGLRTARCTDADIEAACTAGAVLRTHVMRPTWHFVVPEDIRWMQALTSARVEATLAYQYRRLELDAQVLKRSRTALEKVLQGGKQLTRAELGAAMARAGIYVDGLALAHVILHAELQALLCSGPRRGKQFTYALVAERAPHAKELGGEEALALLTERYFTSHGPATARDFAWWSGLTSAEVRAGLDLVKARLVSEEIEGRTYWMPASTPAARHPRSATHLLGNYDEYIVGYTDRDEIFDKIHAERLDERHNPLFNHTIVSAGRITGTWTRRITKEGVHVDAKPFSEPSKGQARAIAQAEKRHLRFLGKAGKETSKEVNK